MRALLSDLYRAIRQGIETFRAIRAWRARGLNVDEAPYF